MSWDLLKRFLESDVFNQNPFLSVSYLSCVPFPRPSFNPVGAPRSLLTAWLLTFCDVVHLAAAALC